MGCDIHYMVERKDTQGRWHLIETTENLYEKFFKLDLDTKGGLERYFNHPAVALRDRNYEIFANFSEVRGSPISQKVMYDVDVENLGQYDFHPITKTFLNHFSQGYHSYGYQSFENIIKFLDENKGEPFDHYNKLFIKSIKYFSSLNVLEKVLFGKEIISLQSIVSSHKYLELISAELLPMTNDNIRMIVYYDS